MKNKYAILSLCLTALILLTSCKKAPAEQPKFILNGFDSVQELYSIRPAIQLMDGSMDIVTKDSGMVKSGTGSALLIYERGSSPYMTLHLQQTAYPDLKLSHMCEMNLSVYNDNQQTIPCEITLVGTDYTPLLTQEYILQPDRWNDLELLLTAGSFDPAQVLGFALRLDAPENSRFYLDEWAVVEAL